MKKAFFAILLMSIVWQACKHDLPTMPDPTPTKPTKDTVELSTDSVCNPSTVYFVNDVMPIINSSCAYSGCHDAASQSDGVDLSSYNAIFNSSEEDDLIVPGLPGESDLYEVIEKDKMPLNASPLSASTKQLIYDWIAQGAKYNECVESDSATCDTSNVSFSQDVQPLLNTHCVGCHTGASANKGVELTDYSKVSFHVGSGKLKSALLGQNGVAVMPPSNNLDDCDLNKLIKWIDDGGQNN